MKYLICIGHPAQFHLFKNIIYQLHEHGHETKVLITTKDILEYLFKKSGLGYKNVLPRRKSGSFISLTSNFARRYIIIAKEIMRFKPNLLMGSEVTLPILGKSFNIPSIIFSEDDAKIIPQYAKLAFPYASTILSPISCNAGKWERKKIGYDGFQKLVYLHPNRYSPQKSRINSLTINKYFLLRFAKLSAYHDTQREGITQSIAKRLIDILKPHGNIFISSERKLEPQLEKYRISIDPIDMHSALYFADIYIGDSQSMAVEAAILGTPGIRFNDFAGEIGVLEELEQKYNLTFGIKTIYPEKLYTKVFELVNRNELKKDFEIRQKKLLNEKIDVLPFMIWFIENYPESKSIMQENPDYQYNFK